MPENDRRLADALRLTAFCLLTAPAVANGPQDRMTIHAHMVHLRNQAAREWSEFPEQPDGRQLERHFTVENGKRFASLVCRQQDVKQPWSVFINDVRIGELTRDENDMTVYFSIPPEALVAGDNLLRIHCAPAVTASDDIRVGELAVDARAVAELLGESSVTIRVVDVERDELIPCRLTIVDSSGSLQTISGGSQGNMAVRAGTIYTANGRATFGLPAGRYTVYAGRGFEYSLDKVQFVIQPGEAAEHQMAIRRTVATHGYVACDTHVHTLTHSGHGDATLAERLVTLAGEGIELPIATDHNVHVDYRPLAESIGLNRYFTPVIGNEVTTAVGHFNIFPVERGARVPNFRLRDWAEIFDEIYATPRVRVAILNHPRDLHSGVRPFDPKHHNAVLGENRSGWPMRFNAVEVVNSSATQSDIMRLFHDWMGLLNRGYFVTPVGSSDSHDVLRHFVGQGRTYIRCNDRDPGHIDIDEAVESFLAGRVLVSYGLIAELTVDGKYQSGDLAAAADSDVRVDVRVSGPQWVRATQVRLYSNGTLIREQALGDSTATATPGVLWQGRWTLPRPKHDVHLVAIATGAGIDDPFWRTAKPYQPVSEQWSARTIGCSGAVWLDGDGDNRRTAAREYAERIDNGSQGDPAAVIAALGRYDAATAAQAAHRLHSSGIPLGSDLVTRSLKAAPDQVRVGFMEYRKAANEPPPADR